MPKNKTIRGLTALLIGTFVSTLLWGCADKKVEDESMWSSTDAFYSADSITASKASIGTNGDLVIVWQEQETEVRNDAVKDADHQFVGILPAIDPHSNLHSHKLLYTKTTIKARSYDASAGSWRATISLGAGFWEKSKSGILDINDAADNSKTVYDENINNTFIGDIAVSVNGVGSAVVTWVQLAEGAVMGDAGADHSMFVYFYNAATNTWSASTVVTGAIVVQNSLDVSLNDSNIAHLVWLGRDNLTFKVNAYQNIYNGSTWSSTAMLSDGNGSVRDIALAARNQTSGVAVWTQFETKVIAADSEMCDQANFNAMPLNLMSNWFNATAWNATPQKISDTTGDVKDFVVATNDNGSIWASWVQNSNASNPCATNLSSYLVSDVSTVKASQFSNDIDADVTSGIWSAAANIQTDIAVTSIDESTLDSAQTSIAVDASGNVVVAWVEKGDAEVVPRRNSLIRVNANAAGSWMAESIIVSDVSRFESAQPFEKTLPNDHVAPNVVSTSANQFTISWQYWSVSAAASGYQVFSVDYNASANVISSFKTVSESVSSVVNQMDVFSVNGGVQMLWSQEENLSTRLTKSVK